LERNADHSNSLDHLFADQPTRNSIDTYTEFKLDNEVNRIINEGPSLPQTGSIKKHQTSALQQESTDIATDEYTARKSNKLTESPTKSCLKTVNKEIVLDTAQTILEDSLQTVQNKDLQDVNEGEGGSQSKEADFLDYIKYLLENRDQTSEEEIITEIEKQYLLDNKEFEDELEEIKYQISQKEEEIREAKKQKYWVWWPSPSGEEAESKQVQNNHLIDKNSLQEEFLSIWVDIRKEVLKTKFIRGVPSIESQLKNAHLKDNLSPTEQQKANIQSILDLVVSNDDLLNKFYDIIFNPENQALKLPQVNSGDNKRWDLMLIFSLKEKLKSVDFKVGTRKYGVLTSDALNDTLKQTSIMDFIGLSTEKQKKQRYNGHDLNRAVNERMKQNSRSFRHRNENQKMTISPYTNIYHGDDKYAHLEEAKSDFGRYANAQPIVDKSSSKMYISKSRRKIKKPGLVIKNGKLLLKKKTIS
jgi:hypothetical protein